MKKITKTAVMLATLTGSVATFAQDVVIDFPTGKSCTLTLSQSSSANSLLKLLPQELKLEDYGHTERIAYLKERLETEGEGYEPHAGDLCYYAPWGNLAFFKEDFRYSKGLFYIGNVSKECLKELVNSTSVVIKTNSKD